MRQVIITALGFWKAMKTIVFRKALISNRSALCLLHWHSWVFRSKWLEWTIVLHAGFRVQFMCASRCNSWCWLSHLEACLAQGQLTCRTVCLWGFLFIPSGLTRTVCPRSPALNSTNLQDRGGVPSPLQHLPYGTSPGLRFGELVPLHFPEGC